MYTYSLPSLAEATLTSLLAFHCFFQLRIEIAKYYFLDPVEGEAQHSQ